ncbi:MAG TPA: HypC/HybG/HupF family hydrogenase formation chaperone [Candidatus Limnocylindrales bacterium]|nr:HypC/HybG/HupF family hydrogenase formation chaperone [Candidatus Limnocylindrales bacterium]
MCLGVPGRVLEVRRERELLTATVDFGGVCRSVCLEHVPDTVPGEYVLVHVGFALSRIDEAEAIRIFALMRELDELDEFQNGS